MIKIIFFDFDGVLVESVDIKTTAFARLFKNEGEGPVKEIVTYHLNNAGVSRYDKFRYIYKEILKRSLEGNEFNMLCDNFAALVIDEVVNAPYVNGAKEFLVDYASGYNCFIVSATPQQEIEEIVIRRNMRNFFKQIYGSPTQKADAVKMVLAEEGIEPLCAVFIGDALSDYMAAAANKTNFVARINKNEAVFKDIECLRIEDLSGLAEILREM